MMHKFLIISFAFIASNQNEVSSFAQLSMQHGQRTLPQPFQATPQQTLDLFINNAQQLDLQFVATTIYDSWQVQDKKSKKYKTFKANVNKNAWPRKLVERTQRNLGGISDKPIATQINLRAAVEAILKLGYWFKTNAQVGDRQTFNEDAARHFFHVFIQNWDRTMSERQIQQAIQVVDADDQYLIKSRTARIVLGDVREVEVLRAARQSAEPQIPQHETNARICKLVNVNNRRAWIQMGTGYCVGQQGNLIAGSQQTCQGGGNQWFPVAAHPAEQVIRQIVTGLKSEAAFHIHNDHNQWKNMIDINKEQSQVWAFAQEHFDLMGKSVSIEFKVNDTDNEIQPRKLVVAVANSVNTSSWIQSLERYLASDAFEKMPEAFHNIFFGTGNGGALNDADGVRNNIGFVHKLYTRHAFSCANAAKTLGAVLKPNVQTLADVLLLPAAFKKGGMAYLKNSDFRDSKLTDLGVHNSFVGGYRLAETCHAAGIPAPSKVFTSTMQRTLETARYMQEGMAAYAGTTNNNWPFQTLPMTIMPGIKELGSGAENQPRDTINELYDTIDAANANGINGQFGWQADANTIDDTWITGHNSNWANHANYDNFAYFQQKMGEKLRTDIAGLQANGQNNIREQTIMITTHSRQMKSWFGVFVGDNKPDNNDTWKFEYIRMPDANGDRFILVEPVPERPNPKNVRVSVRNAQWREGQPDHMEFTNYYRGFKQRKALSMEVGNINNLNNAIVEKKKFKGEYCQRCGSNLLTFYATTGL